MSGPEVSHGRGGAGNINPDNTEYVDGEIVRQGDVGTHGDGAYSTGRGGKLPIYLPPPSRSLPFILPTYTIAAQHPNSPTLKLTSSSPPRQIGAANIADKEAPVAPRTDKEFVPAEAVRPSVDGDFHTGRGGAANVVHAPEPKDESGAATKPPPNQGLADKLKYKIFGVFKK
ncbi:hypothetical protein EKO27_g8950 [Xylaria grammica]|uniref:Uncharacterized protein n=1 Tax=Xylaria grammica TaxID=363999 RepID=A0A439CVF8_9PEZI|nr:hypothetical protein EKO27_g8950 [Xylaria grammica]